ncbi:antibiotic biosynthesis monooxygenase family protein [Protofrankia symbiont of Coriaria ruscifolia]|uniref:antibiotic biosynthesis monooxygenase family protein n=1 Tax=Protofrankia symbiont of Coriaria ruscifolia TaxID=1306542 RepID=UPI001040EB8A|nr:antibiotic biosynthesis monooxygenase family protein [Protofrankia symbiont of Coriaria ruscifolia]
MVFFVNKLTLTGSAQELERIYAAVADFMSEQDGLISYVLVRSTTRPDVYLNIAEWRDAEAFHRARTQESFQQGERVNAVADGDRHVCEVVLLGGPGTPRTAPADLAVPADLAARAGPADLAAPVAASDGPATRR